LGPGPITNGGGNFFVEGVFFQFANHAEVSGITVLGSGAGIVAANSDFLTITGNTLGRNGLGIEMIDVHSSTISGNDASGSSASGMDASERFVGSDPLGTVSHNIFNGNTLDGLLVGAFRGATIEHNVTNGNGLNGIVLGSTNDRSQ